jgi:hypothetical protein
MDRHTAEPPPKPKKVTAECEIARQRGCLPLCAFGLAAAVLQTSSNRRLLQVQLSKQSKHSVMPPCV